LAALQEGFVSEVLVKLALKATRGGVKYQFCARERPTICEEVVVVDFQECWFWWVGGLFFRL
jgi:hypothetical protein